MSPALKIDYRSGSFYINQPGSSKMDTRFCLLVLFVVSGVMHFACIVARSVLWDQHVRENKLPSHIYSFYRSRVSVASLQADGARNSTSFTEDMYRAYVKICPLKTTKTDRLLILQGPPDAALDLHNLTQSWMPVTHPLFETWESNGYVILLSCHVSPDVC